jgi:hypothetical protein
MKRVQYLGYIVDEHGVHTNPTNIGAIHEFPVTTTLIELHSVIGLTNFYRRLVLEFSHITWPLIQVTKGSGKDKFVCAKSQ